MREHAKASMMLDTEAAAASLRHRGSDADSPAESD
jgi:hypothetical protein